MKILHVVHAFFPRHRHGTERVTLELASAQRQAGHEVVIVAGQHGRAGREVSIWREDYDGFEVHRVTFNPVQPQGFLHHEGLKQSITSLFTALSPDIVHIQHLATLSLDVIHAACDAGLPVFYTLHDYYPSCARIMLMRGDGSLCDSTDLVEECAACLKQQPSYLREHKLASVWHLMSWNLVRSDGWRRLGTAVTAKLRRVQPLLSLSTPDQLRERNQRLDQAYARVQRFISPSSDHADRFARLARIPRERIIAPLQVVDTSHIRHRTHEPGKPLRLLYLGKLDASKGLHIILKALHHLPNGLAKLVAVGPPMATSLVSMAYDLELERLRKGLDVDIQRRAYKFEELDELLAHFDVLVMPSFWYETYGRTVDEAHAAGLPVIASDAAGPAERVREGVNGLLFRNGDDLSLAEKIRWAAEHPADIRKMSEACEPPESPAQVAMRFEELYRSVIEEAEAREEK